MMRYVIGNWKMHGTLSSARALAEALKKEEVPEGIAVVLCPPHVHMEAVAESTRSSSIALGAQNLSAHHEGAYTGETSAAMLADLGCRYVLVGHSERRSQWHETNELVRAKAESALAAGIAPIICIGESLEEREAGHTIEVLRSQLIGSLPKNAQHGLIAYEPVWAIGTGKTPNAEDIARAHAAIGALTALPIVYGGSVKPGNAAEIMAVQGVSGVLVGGASLDVKAFTAIMKAA